MTTWQPIETAPEKREVLVCGISRAGPYVTIGKLEEGIWFLFDPLQDDFTVESGPHASWMPLPELPAALTVGEG